VPFSSCNQIWLAHDIFHVHLQQWQMNTLSMSSYGGFSCHSLTFPILTRQSLSGCGDLSQTWTIRKTFLSA